jgi:hypothetical protein
LAKNNLEQIGLSLFPNPSSDLIVVQSYSPTLSDLKVELIDINGKLILADTLKQGSTMCYLNSQTVYSGVYFVKISDDRSSITKKITITH